MLVPKHGDRLLDSATKGTPDQKNKNRRRFIARGGQVDAPHELFARPPLSPLFHLYTLAPLYLPIESDGRARFRYWTLVLRASHPGLSRPEPLPESFI